MNDLRNALRSALVTQFRFDQSRLEDDTALFSSGAIDSLNIMELVSFVEKQIGQPIPPTAITLDNFDSIEQIIAFVATLPEMGKSS